MKQDRFLCVNDDDWRWCTWCRSVATPALLRTTNRFLGCQIILEVDRATNGYVYAWASDDRGVRDGRHWLHCFVHHSRSLAARLQSANDCSRPRWNKILHSLTPLPNLLRKEGKEGRWLRCCNWRDLWCCLICISFPISGSSYGWIISDRMHRKSNQVLGRSPIPSTKYLFRP